MGSVNSNERKQTNLHAVILQLVSKELSHPLIISESATLKMGGYSFCWTSSVSCSGPSPTFYALFSMADTGSVETLVLQFL